nr:DUF2254 domain-containing protein [Longimicrobium terrae]
MRATYWFIPSLMAVGAAALALGLVQADHMLSARQTAALGWVFSGGPEGARSLLAMVAGSVMGTAGVTFSITIAALTLASSQLGPRLLSGFMRDRGNQFVLGTFIATFTYCLLVLRTVRGDEEVTRFVPALAVTGGLVLGLASLGVLIYFIHHVAVSIQAPNVVASVGRELAREVEREFAIPDGSEPSLDATLPDGFDERADAVPSPADGYVQAVDDRGLLRFAERTGTLLVAEMRPGSFVIEGGPLVRAWPPESLDDEGRRALRACFVIGSQRTAEQDVEFAVDQLVEVAVRALSPAINDPFTAMGSLDWLGAALCRAARGRTPYSFVRGADGEVRVVQRCPIRFVGLVDAAFNQIRQFGARSPAVVLRMLETIHAVLRCTRGDPDEVDALVRHAEMVHRAGMDGAAEPRDRADIEDRYRDVLYAARDLLARVTAGAAADG